MRPHLAVWTGALLTVLLTVSGCGNDNGFERVAGEATLGGRTG